MEDQASFEEHSGPSGVILVRGHDTEFDRRPGTHRRVAHLACSRLLFLGEGSSRRMVIHFKDHGHALWDVPLPVADELPDDLVNAGWICLNHERVSRPYFDRVPLGPQGLGG